MSDWKEIKTQIDIDELLEIYGGFHDSCIVSMNFRSGAFVDDEMAMNFGCASERELLVIFHSQGEPKITEFCFTGLRQLHLTGWQDNFHVAAISYDEKRNERYKVTGIREMDRELYERALEALSKTKTMAA